VKNLIAPTMRDLAALVDGLPDGPRLLVAAFDDLHDPTELAPEDVAAWWLRAVQHYREEPTREQAERILAGDWDAPALCGWLRPS